MKKLSTILLCALLMAALLLCGCSKSYHRTEDNYGSSIAQPAYDAALNGSTVAEAPNGADGSAVAVNRKVIRNAELIVETLDFDTFISNMNAKLRQLGGYVQSNSVDSSDYSRGVLRTAVTVVRVPSDKLDEFLDDVNGAGNVIRRDETTEDVTDRYYDIDAHLTSLRTEYDSLIGLLDNAENLDDIIKIQDRITTVRYQIETCEAQLRSYDSRIDYSTVSLRISEVRQETVVSEESFGEETSRRFRESLNEVGNGFKNFAKWFIGNLPHIVIALLFTGLSIFVPIHCVKSAKRRRQRKAAAQQTASNTENK